VPRAGAAFPLSKSTMESMPMRVRCTVLACVAALSVVASSDAAEPVAKRFPIPQYGAAPLELPPIPFPMPRPFPCRPASPLRW